MSTTISTYNVLSSSLSDPSYFYKCEPTACLPQNRLPVVKKKLQAEMKKEAVICLQELSIAWNGDLYPFFARNGYTLITGMYGKRFNGYMGVGIAVPTEKYDILDSDITVISDTKRVPRAEKNFNLVATFANLGLSALRKLKLVAPAERGAWEVAAGRFNQMVTVRLKAKKNSQARPFCVSTYHMPCIFQLPAVMMIHTALSAQHAERIAGTDPYVFCGDFNMKPDSSMYRLITTGSVEEGCSDLPERAERDTDDWECAVEPLRSAYKDFDGREPAFTNFALTRGMSEPFIETLDYIFLSEQWKVRGVGALPTEEKLSPKGPLPTISEPSDHLLISADLDL